MSECVELWVTEPERRHLYGVYVSLICRGSTAQSCGVGLTKRAAERRAFVKAHKMARNVGYSPRAYSIRRTWWKDRG